MRNKKLIYVALTAFSVLTLAASWTMSGLTQSKTEDADLSFAGKTNKEVYILGEPITVEFEFFNEGTSPMLVAGTGVESGGLKVFIARGQNGEYKEYSGSGWGRLRGKYITLDPRQSSKLKEATILWNGKADVSHLNDTAANRALKGKITTEYALPDPGIYLIKGRSYFGGDATPIESKPIKVVIGEPVGIDLEVWNQIKGNREIAYLMQKGAFDTGEEAKKEHLANQVEQIFTQFPNSIYSSYLKQNLEKYKANEAKRNEAYKNMKLGQKPE